MAFGDIILKRLETLISQAEEMANQPVWLLASWERDKPHFSKSSCSQSCWTDSATVKEWDGKMERSAQKHRVDTPRLHSEAFLSCCLKSRASLLASHIIAWPLGKEKALISFLSPVWDKDHTKCKSSHSMSYILTQALPIQEKVCPCYTAQGDRQNTNKPRCYCLCHEFKPEAGEKSVPASTSTASGHRQAEQDQGNPSGPSPSQQLLSWVGRSNNRSWSYGNNRKY